MTTPLRALFVEDSDDDFRLVVRALTKGGYSVTAERVETADALREALSAPPWDLVICDYTLPSLDGLKALQLVQASGTDPAFIVVSGTIGEETAVEVLKAGAHDFVTKGQLARLLPAVRRELREVTVRREHRTSEQALRDSEARFRHLVEASNDWIWETDAQARYTYVSPLCRDLLGYEPQELLGTTVFDLIEPDDVSRVRDAYATLAAGHGLLRGLEYGRRHKDGRLLVLETNGTRVTDAEGTFCGYRGIDRDITARRRLEDQFRQAQKMEAVGTLAGGIAHDFNNLLTTVLGYSSLILKRLPPTDPIARDILEIQEAANQAAVLTRRLLAFSRKEKVVPQVLDVAGLLERMESMLHRILGEDVALSIQGSGSKVKADPGQLEQVVMNLAVNARDAMSHGGVLTIASADIVVQAGAQAEVPPGSYVSVAVSDNGSGMDALTQSRAFEPFFTTKPIGKGTGLGLSTVYGIVTQFGGYVRVSSEVGKGATFRIYLPHVEAQNAPAALETPSSRVHGGSETVLVVEDEDAVRRLMRTTLEGAGYTVLEAQDGLEAVTLYDQKRDTVRLVVTDVIMPHLDGGALAEWMSSVGSSIKVLFISGWTGAVLESKGVFLTGAPFLSKPFSPEELLLKVREVLDGGRAGTGTRTQTS
jgi:two-component system, cell cycle sensor histidine kinase and response regulator CckA